MKMTWACAACGTKVEINSEVKASPCPNCGSPSFGPAAPAATRGRGAGGCNLRRWRSGLPVLILAGSLAGGIAIAAGYPSAASVIIGTVSLAASLWTFVAVSTWMINVLDAVSNRPRG